MFQGTHTYEHRHLTLHDAASEIKKVLKSKTFWCELGAISLGLLMVLIIFWGGMSGFRSGFDIYWDFTPLP